MLPLPVHTTDLVILAVAGYVAIIALVRLMLAERRRMGQDLDAQINAEERRIAAEKKKTKKAA